MSNFMKIRPVGAELLHADGRPDERDEGNSSFFPNFANAPKSVHRWRAFPRDEAVVTLMWDTQLAVNTSHEPDDRRWIPVSANVFPFDATIRRALGDTKVY